MPNVLQRFSEATKRKLRKARKKQVFSKACLAKKSATMKRRHQEKLRAAKNKD